MAVQVLDGWDAAGLKAIASAMAAPGGAAVALVVGVIACVRRRSLVLPDVPIDASAVLKQLIERFGGRGGGKPDLAQGGGLNADPTEIAIAARALLET